MPLVHAQWCIIVLFCIFMKGRAKQLLSVGVKTPQDLAKADPLDLCRQVEHLYPKQARKLVAAAKV